MTTTLEIKRTDDGYELSCPVVNRDFHVRYEPDANPLIPWVLDEFDSEIGDDQNSHIESSNHVSFQEAINEAFNRCEDILNNKNK